MMAISRQWCYFIGMSRNAARNNIVRFSELKAEIRESFHVQLFFAAPRGCCGTDGRCGIRGPAVTPDITKVDSIEDGFGYFRLLWEKTVAWFRSEQENLLELAIGIAVTIIVAFLVRWLFRALLPKLLRKLPSELPLKIVDRLGAPLTLLILLVGFSACNNLVHLPGAIALWLGKIFYAGFILAFLWGIFRIISWWISTCGRGGSMKIASSISCSPISFVAPSKPPCG